MTTLDLLSNIIPADQALANKALSVALRQINGIEDMTLPTFAATVSKTQTMVDLPLINAQTTPVSPAATTYFKNSATGSSTNKTYVIYDFLGTATGTLGTPIMVNTVAQLATMNTSTLESIYEDMVNTLNGTYGVPPAPIVIPSGPAAGTYATVALAMAALIAAANAECANLAAAYPSQAASVNAGWIKLATAQATETANQAKAGLVWANLVANSQQSIISLVQALPDLGQDKAVGGEAQFFDNIVVKTNVTGQAIIGTFRQGATTPALNNAGISTSNNVPTNPVPPPPQITQGPTTS